MFQRVGILLSVPRTKQFALQSVLLCGGSTVPRHPQAYIRTGSSQLFLCSGIHRASTFSQSTPACDLSGSCSQPVVHSMPAAILHDPRFAGGKAEDCDRESFGRCKLYEVDQAADAASLHNILGTFVELSQRSELIFQRCHNAAPKSQVQTAIS